MDNERIEECWKTVQSNSVQMEREIQKIFRKKLLPITKYRPDKRKNREYNYEIYRVG